MKVLTGFIFDIKKEQNFKKEQKEAVRFEKAAALFWVYFPERFQHSLKGNEKILIIESEKCEGV